MIRHIFKLIWNQKSKYLSIFIEQACVTIVLMLCIVSIISSVKKHNEPGMFSTKNNILFGYMVSREHLKSYNPNELAQNMQAINLNLSKKSYVNSITKSMFLTPYLRPGENYYIDSVAIDGKRIECSIKFADMYANDVFKPKILDGRWINNDKLKDGSFQAVVTQQFVNEANWHDVLNKKITLYGRTYTIVGVIEGAKQQVFEPSPISIILPIEVYGNSFFIEYVANINNNERTSFFDDYYKEFRRYMPQYGIEPVITDINVWKQKSMLPVFSSVILQSIPTFFLLIFSFIGTFGIFWLYSKKRINEFALRLALGSTKRKISVFVIIESLIITLMAIFPAFLLSIFIYEINLVYAISIPITFIIMILFSLISAYYPAWKASKISPAEALQYE